MYKFLDWKKYYRVAIASWIGDGGNGYQVFKNYRQNLVRGPTSLSVVEKYFRKLRTIVSALDKRIKIIEELT